MTQEEILDLKPMLIKARHNNCSHVIIVEDKNHVRTTIPVTRGLNPRKLCKEYNKIGKVKAVFSMKLDLDQQLIESIPTFYD